MTIYGIENTIVSDDVIQSVDSTPSNRTKNCRETNKIKVYRSESVSSMEIGCLFKEWDLLSSPNNSERLKVDRPESLTSMNIGCLFEKLDRPSPPAIIR